MAIRWDDPSLVQQVEVDPDDQAWDEDWAMQYPSAGPTAAEVMKTRHESGSLRHGSLFEKPQEGKSYKTIRRTIDVGATKSILKAKGRKALEPGQKGMYLCAVTDAVWTKTRLKEAQYDVDVTCDKCGNGADTLHHRVW